MIKIGPIHTSTRTPADIYIAGGSSELLIARRMISEVQRFGFRVTHDWTADPGWDVVHRQGPVFVDNRTLEERTASATADVNGVLRAHTFWLLAPEYPSRGAYTEQGVAIAQRFNKGGTIIVSGPHAGKDLFSSVADRVFGTHERALQYLKDFLFDYWGGNS